MIMKGISPAIGEIILSFAYVIIALGISSSLGRVAEGGHLKVLKLMAWQNLFQDNEDNEDDGATTTSTTAAAATSIVADTSSSVMKSSTATSSDVTKSKKQGKSRWWGRKNRNIQGLFSRYTYMIQLIVSEIHKAYTVGRRQHHQLVAPATATNAPMATTSPFSRYASILNTSFQEIFKDNQKKKDGGGRMNWEEYTNLLQEKRSKRKKMEQQQLGGRRTTNGGSVVYYNKDAMMFERRIKSDYSDGKFDKRECPLCPTCAIVFSVVCKISRLNHPSFFPPPLLIHPPTNSRSNQKEGNRSLRTKAI